MLRFGALGNGRRPHSRKLLSLVAFIQEEVVNSCRSCTALYFFEFVSCTAFLFTLLLLILLSTNLHTRVGITCWPVLVRVFCSHSYILHQTLKLTDKQLF
eukprot:superscaffoldBa00006209_g21263